MNTKVDRCVCSIGVVVQSAITSCIYKRQLDFPCKEQAWIHVQSPTFESNSDGYFHNCSV